MPPNKICEAALGFYSFLTYYCRDAKDASAVLLSELCYSQVTSIFPYMAYKGTTSTVKYVHCGKLPRKSKVEEACVCVLGVLSFYVIE